MSKNCARSFNGFLVNSSQAGFVHLATISYLKITHLRFNRRHFYKQILAFLSITSL